MPRTRSTSIASSTQETPRRQSSRASVPPPPFTFAPSFAVAPPPKPERAKAKRRKASGSKTAAKDEEEEDIDQLVSSGEEEAMVTITRKPVKRSRSVTPARARTPKPVIPKVKAPRAITKGINALPTLFSTLPQFSFPHLASHVPNSVDSPRIALVFGNGEFGQHGLGVDGSVLGDISMPKVHTWLEKAVGGDGWEKGIAKTACGGMHTLCLDSVGRVWSWGINDNAALGRSTLKEDIESEILETQPMLVERLVEEEFKAVSIAAGDSFSLAVSQYGELRCWGSFRASEGLLGFDGTADASQTQLRPIGLRNLESQTIIQVATGDDHFIALTSTGYVYAAGNGEQNQLGRKIIQRHKAHGLTPERLSLRNIVLVGSGSYHSFAVNSQGSVFAWGLNSFHQTGISDSLGGWQDTISSPTLVGALEPSEHDGARVVQIEGGDHHSLFLFSNGEVCSCGRCDGHEVGLGPDQPSMIESRGREGKALKLRATRQEEAVGRIEAERKAEATEMNGQDAAVLAAEAAALGVPLPNPYIPTPTLVSFPDNEKIVQIAAASRHSFALSSTGKLYAWGVGFNAQLGLAELQEAEVPTEVTSEDLKGLRILSVSTGGGHNIILACREASGSEDEGENIKDGEDLLGDTTMELDKAEEGKSA